MSDSDYEAFKRRVSEAQAKAKAERDEEHSRARGRANVLWNESMPAIESHPYLIRTLRSAFEVYPTLLASLPDKTSPVDTLPLGISKFAVLSGKRVLRQGAFTGEHVSSGNTEVNP